MFFVDQFRRPKFRLISQVCLVQCHVGTPINQFPISATTTRLLTEQSQLKQERIEDNYKQYYFSNQSLLLDK